MPAWSARPPWAVPARLAGFGPLPQGKVHGIFLDRIDFHPGAGHHIIQRATGQATIVPEARHTVEYIAARCIGEPPVHQLFVIEVGKAFGEGKLRFYDPEEFERILGLYGPMNHLQTPGKKI